MNVGSFMIDRTDKNSYVHMFYNVVTYDIILLKHVFIYNKICKYL